MNKITSTSLIAAALAVPVLWQLTPAFAQAPAGQAAPGQGQGRGGRGGGKGGPRIPDAPTGPAPHMKDGKVDFTGNWQPNAIGQNINLASVGGEPEMTEWAKKLYDDHKSNISKDDPEARCLPPGVPRMSTTPYPWSMIQNDKELVIVYEGGAHIWRKIFLDGRPHNPQTEDTWLGDSTGKWIDNETLEVETVGQNDKTWLDEDGHPHTKNMIVKETFRRPDEGHLVIDHEIIDPEAYPKGWKFTTHPTQLKGELIEYICQENNRDVQHLIGK